MQAQPTLSLVEERNAELGEDVLSRMEAGPQGWRSSASQEACTGALSSWCRLASLFTTKAPFVQDCGKVQLRWSLQLTVFTHRHTHTTFLSLSALQAVMQPEGGGTEGAAMRCVSIPSHLPLMAVVATCRCSPLPPLAVLLTPGS